VRRFAFGAIVCVYIAATGAATAQQQFPTLERGLNPGRLYHFNGIDTVNVFSGSLNLLLPVGGSYPVNGGLSYKLTLSYNSKVWDFAKSGPAVVAAPSPRWNAGLGWSFGFGSFVPLDDPGSNSFADAYVSVDGSEHRFEKTIAGESFVKYTMDGSALRLRTFSSGSTIAEIDFPDGTVQRYEKSIIGKWELREIRAARGTAKVTIDTRHAVGGVLLRPAACLLTDDDWWRVSDGSRTHYMCFDNYNMDDVDAPMITKVALDGFGAQSSVYSFAYQQLTDIVRPLGEHIPPDMNFRLHHKAAVLKSVVLPDLTTFQFDVAGDQLQAMVLPTGARIEYSWNPLYDVPSAAICTFGYNSADPSPGIGSPQSVVTGRTVRPALPAGRTPEAHTWTYAYSKVWSPAGSYCMGPGNTPNLVANPMPDELISTVTDPAGGRTESHFSVWPGDMISDSSRGFRGLHNGFPYGVYDSGQNRYLSQEQYQCAGSSCGKRRSTYVRHDLEMRPQSIPSMPNVAMPYHRLASQRTFNHDDPAGCTGAAGASPCRSITSELTNWDGYGHYRTATTAHDFGGGGQRSVTTSWNTINGVARTVGPGERWFVNEFEKVTTIEGSDASIEQLCFGTDTGDRRLLKARRVLKAGSVGAHDLITVYGLGPDANVASERFYGGDSAPLQAGVAAQADLCTALSSLTANPSYEIGYTWQHGVLASSQYAGTTFKTLDLTVDSSGMVAQSRDSSELTTTYSYDGSGRILTGQPPGSAAFSYEYLPAMLATDGTLARPATAIQIVGSGTGRSEARYQFDSLGRLWREKVLQPGNLWTLSEILYDSLGRRSATSERQNLPAGQDELLFQPSGLTMYGDYDIFGRVGRITAPDQSVSRFEYVGSREIRRFSSGPTMAEKLRSTELYDGFGRLTGVIERPDATGDVVASYGYDVGGRLRTVQMKAPAGAIQDRIFDYDGRGFLRWESQPESGMSSYTYDARGHVVSRGRSAARSQFDLRYSYDAAERLVEVKGRNPFYDANPNDQPEFRIIKSFQYASANVSTDYRKGKLEFAGRYNYDAWEADAPAYLIQDFYGYQDAAGRRTLRNTSIYRIDAQGSTQLKDMDVAVDYDDFGRESVVYYPMCLDCGGPPADPQRSAMVHQYNQAGLIAVAGFVDGITYWPNGMRNVLGHANGVADTQTVGIMPRPSQIAFGPYERCVAPTILTHPAGSSVPAGGGSTTLSVTMDSLGTQPFGYEWWNVTDDQPAGSTQSILVTLPSGSPSKTYRVTVSNACGFIRSQTAKVTVGACSAPTTGTLTPVLQPDRSFILRPDPEARVGRTYKWKRLSDGVEWTTLTLAVPAPTVDATYSFTVTDDCGSATSSITLKPAMVITATALQATTVTSTQISVQWPAVSGATTYTVERRSGADWAVLGTTSSTTYVDSTVTPSKTYAYRVSASGGGRQSGYSNSDVATTRTFTQAVQYSSVTASVINQMLDAVNSVRAAAGWPAVTWNNILAASDPVPNPGNFVMKRHVTSTRSRMNEALQSLGVPVPGYPDPDLASVPIRAEHINSLLARAQ